MILGGALGTGVAADADALLAATNPEPTVFLAEDRTVFIEQGKADGLIGGGLDEK